MGLELKLSHWILSLFEGKNIHHYINASFLGLKSFFHSSTETFPDTEFESEASKSHMYMTFVLTLKICFFTIQLYIMKNIKHAEKIKVLK